MSQLTREGADRSGNNGAGKTPYFDANMGSESGQRRASGKAVYGDGFLILHRTIGMRTPQPPFQMSCGHSVIRRLALFLHVSRASLTRKHNLVNRCCCRSKPRVQIVLEKSKLLPPCIQAMSRLRKSV